MAFKQWGTNSVEGIKLDMLEPEEVFRGTKAIKQMKRLRLIMVRNMHISGCPEYLSNDLRWLDVHGIDFPATGESYGPAQPSIRDNGMENFASDMLLEEYSMFKTFSKAELARATNDFSDGNKIGIGGGRSVYCGRLYDGQLVAVKWTNLLGDCFEDRMFINEIKTLRYVNHENIIRLLGFHARCSERALVYEYMNHGSLYYHLHILRSSTLMSWNARIKVALDVARGIQYLHEYADPRIIHGDVKLSNILLDGNWTAKVADFGHSILLPKDGPASDENSHLEAVVDAVCPDPIYFNATNITGTRGYVAPEYYITNRLTTKLDVYSYGIVLLELLSGRKALHRAEDGSMSHITDTVVPCIVQGEVELALDPNMPNPASFEIGAVTDMAYLAVDCVQQHAEDRPSMTYVADCLSSASAQCSSM